MRRSLHVSQLAEIMSAAFADPIGKMPLVDCRLRDVVDVFERFARRNHLSTFNGYVSLWIQVRRHAGLPIDPIDSEAEFSLSNLLEEKFRERYLAIERSLRQKRTKQQVRMSGNVKARVKIGA